MTLENPDVQKEIHRLIHGGFSQPAMLVFRVPETLLKKKKTHGNP